jgi:hypothetical protein
LIDRAVDLWWVTGPGRSVTTSGRGKAAVEHACSCGAFLGRALGIVALGHSRAGMLELGSDERAAGAASVTSVAWSPRRPWVVTVGTPAHSHMRLV